MLDVVGNQEDRLSLDVAYMIQYIKVKQGHQVPSKDAVKKKKSTVTVVLTLS